MAKRRTPLDAASKRTQEAIDKLKIYYELGRVAVTRGNSAAGLYARGVITQLVEETGENKATVAADHLKPAIFDHLTSAIW